MLTRLAIGAVALALAVAPAPLAAQQRFTGELRGVVAFPTEELIGAELNTGFGLGIVIAYRLQQHLHLYAGWDYVNFGTDQDIDGTQVDFDETGYTLGLRFVHRATWMASSRNRLKRSK